MNLLRTAETQKNEGLLLSTGVADFRRGDGSLIVFESGSGSRVTDTRGLSYIDFVLGFGPVVLGHGCRTFSKYLNAFRDCAIHLPGYSTHHFKYLELLEKRIGSDWAFAIYKQSSDSVVAAIRLSNALTGRRGVIRAGFLGWHDIAIVNSPSWHEPPSSPLRDRRKLHPAFFPPCSDGVYDWITLELGDLLSALEEKPNAYSTFILDLFQAAYTSRETINEAIDALRTYGVKIVYDETKTCGRQSRQCTYTGLGLPKPDMLILGKAIANGAPLSILAAPPDSAPMFREIRAGGTHSKELTAIYAGLATLESMEELDGYAALRANASRCSTAMNAGVAGTPIEPLLHFEPFADGLIVPTLTGDLLESPPLRERLQRRLADEGILVRLGHPVFVSVAHREVSTSEIEKSFSAASARFRAN